jgi:hypothetical protein
VHVVGAAALVLALGCSGGEEGTAGPCYMRFADPLMAVTQVIDARTGRDLSQVILRRYTYAGGPDTGWGFLTDHFSLRPRNVRTENDALMCDVACAFGASEGVYALTFGAEGYRDTTITVDARYANRSGNCPLTLSQGAVVRVVLTPVSGP